MDKIAELGLTLENPEVVAAPGIRELPLTLECKVRYIQDQDLSLRLEFQKLRIDFGSDDGQIFGEIHQCANPAFGDGACAHDDDFFMRNVHKHGKIGSGFICHKCYSSFEPVLVCTDGFFYLITLWKKRTEKLKKGFKNDERTGMIRLGKDISNQGERI